jgi:hypothetical protein
VTVRFLDIAEIAPDEARRLAEAGPTPGVPTQLPA